MCTSKKVAIAVGAVLAGVLLLATPVGSFVKVKSCNAVSGLFSWCDSQVTPEDKLKDIKAKVAKIDKEISKNIDQLAKMENDAQKVERQVTKLKAEADLKKAELEALTKAADAPVSNRRQSEVLRDLETKTALYEAKKMELAQTQETLAAKRKTVEMAEAKIRAMQTQKEEIKAKVAQLEARIQMVQLKQVNSNAKIDDTLFNEIKNDLGAVEDNLREKEITADKREQFGLINSVPNVDGPTPTRSKEDIVKAAKKALESDETTVIVEQK
jgi:DNA repair exonuclease SbcCD ATPase subunit